MCVFIDLSVYMCRYARGKATIEVDGMRMVVYPDVRICVYIHIYVYLHTCMYIYISG